MLSEDKSFEDLEKSLLEGEDKDIRPSESANEIVCQSACEASNPLPQEVEIESESSNLSSPSRRLSLTSTVSKLAPADIAAQESYESDQIVADKNAKDLFAKTMMFDTFIDLLTFFHTSFHVQEGQSNPEVTLHPWQLEMGNQVSNFQASIEHPFKFALCASNGSGKDSFFIAPLAVWFILCKSKSRVVITSSSGTQLTAQTETYIKNLCWTINSFMEDLGVPKPFKVNQRYIRCLYTGSEIRMYATDEPGKAEGYHPMEPNAPFLIIVNEAKNVKEDIYGAISRCTGFSHKVFVSSAGEPKGSFHFAYKSGLEEKNGWLCRRVTSYDCTHIPRSEIESDKVELGETSGLFRSKHLSLFTSVGGTVVITDDNLTKCKLLCKTWIGKDWPKRVGIDLAAGGDESVITITQGNKIIYQYGFVERDTTITAQIIDRELTVQGIPKNSDYIRADDGGVGRGIIDQLVRLEWRILRVVNQSAARDKRMYGNRGAEMWFSLSRIIQECLWFFDGKEHPKLEEQLTTRHYNQSTGGSNRLFLQPKSDAKAEGHPSPDKGDSFTLSIIDLSVLDFINADKTKTSNGKDKQVVSIEALVAIQERQKFALAESQGRPLNAEELKWSTDPDSIGQDRPTPRNSIYATHSLSEFIGG